MATHDDLGTIDGIERAADELFWTIGFDLEPGPIPGHRRSVADATSPILVIGEPPVGFAQIEIVDGSAHLETLAVLPEYGRRGLGRSLVEAACEWAKDSGHPSISLLTYRDVPWNGPFYARFGFSIMKRPTPGLMALREVERRHGLDDFGKRVVMIRRLD
jgi:GNAT superfamily N-acetyltransferase